MGPESLGDCDRVMECSCIGPSRASSSVIDVHGVDSTSQDVNRQHGIQVVMSNRAPLIWLVWVGKGFSIDRVFRVRYARQDSLNLRLKH